MSYAYQQKIIVYLNISEEIEMNRFIGVSVKTAEEVIEAIKFHKNYQKIVTLNTEDIKKVIDKPRESVFGEFSSQSLLEIVKICNNNNSRSLVIFMKI